MAAASVAATFQHTLLPRNDVDQGLVTGLSMALNYVTASLAQDAVETTAAFMLKKSGKTTAELDDDQLRRVELAFRAAGIIGVLALQMACRQQKGEAMRSAAARTVGFWLSASSLSGFLSGALEDALIMIDKHSARDHGLRHLPVALLGGAAWATVRDIQRRRRERAFGVEEVHSAPVSGVKAIGIGTGIVGALGVLVSSNRLLARGIGLSLDKVLPGDERLWRPIGNLVSLGLIGGVLAVKLDGVIQNMEKGASIVEEVFATPPTSPLVSGSADSHVPWETLSREGRRHISTYMRREWIERIMAEPAVDPIRVYVGLDSAPTEAQRVRLAIAELDRTGAFNRELIIVVSPTGTGYVNYTAIACAELYTRGNCATVTLQYSKRPSPVSLDRIWQGRRHYRMLTAAIRRKLYAMVPSERPRLVAFGESLGALTSQDAFLDTGTQGLMDAGMERGLWIGSPRLSKWKQQVLEEDRLDVDPHQIGEFNSFEEVEALAPARRESLRYFLMSHGNDGVCRFEPTLLIQQPDWLGDPETRPAGVRKSQRYATPITLIQTVIDMNNAMNAGPGEGHDYSQDLPRFVREAYDLKCSDEQFMRVEQVIREYDEIVGEWIGGKTLSTIFDERGVPVSAGS